MSQSQSIPEMINKPTTFTEWLFLTVQADTTIEAGDIVKKFAKANQQQHDWPIHGAELDVFIMFFTEQAMEEVRGAVTKLAREMMNKDFDDYLRLIRHHQTQIEAVYKSSVFALRTAWKDYGLYLASACEDEGCEQFGTLHTHKEQ